MALSQIQCLDDHHVNWRVSEGKPEFFYSEDQRLALEALLYAGREGFAESLDARGTRGFLSEPELERITRTAEAYRPGFEHPPKPEAAGAGNVTPGSAEDGGDGAVSLQYWPDRSEGSVAELDLGWPDAISYRGVTRVAVHTQPPTEGHTHIKEVVRKSIALAQKVIAVVMDVFTDVDIFRDLLDAAFKRKVPVYIIIDQAAVPCFLSMCGRADMHRGHLKNLRVRCCGGVEFYTRSAQKVRGSLSQKFLLVDGDKAISGSYSFTWSSSRLDRNLITVITGQAVETFDIQFRDLFLTSRGVSLSKVSLAEEPMPDIVPQAAPVPVSAAIARKLINPKYALVTTGNHASLASSDQNSSNKNSAGQNPTGLRLIKGRIKETVEGPPLHPGLAHLEKAYLIPYLPTWPEPDPPSDVIGFINIRDDKRANQVHLQRSERFEVSQAIRFSSPFTPPAKTDAHAAGQAEEAAHAATHPSKSEEAPSPLTESNTQPSVQQHTSKNTEHTDERDSGASPQQPNTPQAKRTRNTNSHPKKSETQDAIASQPKETSQQAPEAEASTRPLAPPIPKPRTLQLVIDPSGQSCQPQVSLIKKNQSDLPACSPEVQIQEDPQPVRGHGQSEEAGKDSESNGEGSQDSTKVICDPAANDNPSSDSTGSDEFYDCSAPETSDTLANGVKTGSGRGHRQGDGINVMARLSQSMLDLRAPCPSEDSMALLYQSQQLRRQAHQSPHRHIGQLFQASRSPDREGQMTRAKVILAKPGSFPRAPGASGPVIGGHRYWQDATLQTDSGRTCQEGRSGRSPRRHSPGCRKSGQGCPQPPPNPAGVLGVSFSKLTNLRHLRARGGGSQKRTTHSNKDVS